MRQLILAVALIGLLAVLAAPRAVAGSPLSLAPLAVDYYVAAAAGSDTTGDGSIGAPWKSITHALSALSGSGLSLHAAAGAYDQANGESFPINMKSGISLLGAGYTTTLLAGSAGVPVVLFGGASVYATSTVLSGFNLSGGSEGVRIDASTGPQTAPGVQFNRLMSNTVGLRVTALSGVRVYAEIKNNVIVNNVSDGIVVMGDHANSLAAPIVQDNLMAYNGGAGVYCIAGGSDNDIGYCSPVLRRNRIAENTHDGFTCYTYGAGSCNAELDSNFILNNAGWGIGRAQEATYLAPSRPRFTNNIIAGNALGGAVFHDGSTYRGEVDAPDFVNDTIANNGQYGILGGYPARIVNTIAWGQTSDLSAAVSVVSHSDVSQGLYAGTNGNVSVDPRFVDAPGGDYHLLSVSPVVNAGDCATPDLPPTDIDGEPRVIGPCVDIGADEVTTFWDSSQQAVDRSVALPGQTLLYTLSIRTSRNLTATGVIVTDTLAGIVSFGAASPGGVYANGAVVWSALTVAPSQTAVLTLSAVLSGTLPDDVVAVNHVRISDDTPTIAELSTTTTVIYNAVHSAFSAAPTSGALPLVVTFTNQSTHATGFVWSYGDGFTSTLPATHTHSYNAPGVFTPALQAYNPVSTDFFTYPISISTFYGAQAGFTGSPLVGLWPLAVTFTNTSLYADQFVWDYGDGITATTTAITHVHQYAAAGSFTVSLLARGARDANILTRVNYVNTYDYALASFDATPTSGPYPLLVHFHNQSIGAATYHWEFDDGTTSTAFQPSHFYLNPGIYTVTLTASNPAWSDTLVHPSYITVSALNHLLYLPLVRR